MSSWLASADCCVTSGRNSSDDANKYGVLIEDGQDPPGYSPALYAKGHVGENMITLPPNGSKTIHDLISNCIKEHGSREAVGTRKLIKVHKIEEDGKFFEKWELENEYKFITYTEYGQYIEAFAQGLSHWTKLPAGGKLVIYAETQREWMVAALAAFSMSLQVVTVYATLGEDGAEFAFQQTQVSACVVDAKLMKVLNKIAPKLKHLKYVIPMGECDAANKEMLEKIGKEMKTFDEVTREGRMITEDLKISRPPNAEDIAIIMYTSGTTGAPKGVMLKHENFVAGTAGMLDVGSEVGFGPETRYLAYLPLAHIMEMIAEVAIFAFGASMGYGTPHTLVETGVKLKRPESEGDAVLLKPDVMVFAPAVFDKVYKAVLRKVEGASYIARSLFSMALSVGMSNFDNNSGIGVNPLLNVVFHNVQKLLGGNVRMALTGSAPLSPEIQRFMQTVLKAPVRQAYGLTENCACGTVCRLDDNAVKVVGAPLGCTVIRLADWPEGGYFSSDKDKPEIGMHRGEVLVGGPTVCAGYYVDESNKDPEIVKKNAEEFVTIRGVRYFRTGDIAQITSEGTLMIIDRKKDLWKGPQGEYVALSKVEAALKLSPYVELAMAYGKVGGEYCIALLCVLEAPIVKFAQDEGIEETSIEKLCNMPAIIEEVSRSCKEKCVESKLVAFEIPAKFGLVPPVDALAAWTPENNMLTAAMKLKRPVIAKAHETELESLYK